MVAGDRLRDAHVWDSITGCPARSVCPVESSLISEGLNERGSGRKFLWERDSSWPSCLVYSAFFSQVFLTDFRMNSALRVPY